MKKLLLASVLGLSSLVASANNKIQVVNGLPACMGLVTVQFNAYIEGTCAFDISSPVYPAPMGPGAIYDLTDPSTWAPAVLNMPSYETFTAIVCVQCPGMSAPFCLPEVFIDMVPAHACVPFSSNSSTVIPGACCVPTIGDDVLATGGGVCFTLKIHP